MKKVLAAVVMVIAFAMPSHAQFKFGVTAGMNVSNVNAETTQSVKAFVNSRSGFFVGPTVKFSLPLIGLGFDASAVYDQREGDLKQDEESRTIKAQSVQIPINVRYGIGLGDMAEIFAFAGPQFGFNIGSDKTLSEYASDVKSTWTLKSSNLSANVGLGATVLGKVQVKANYNFALGKTGEVELDKNGVKEIVGNAKMNAWQVSLAYWF